MIGRAEDKGGKKKENDETTSKLLRNESTIMEWKDYVSQ